MFPTFVFVLYWNLYIDVVILLFKIKILPIASIWCKTMLGNLCADTICSEKRTVFRSEPFFARKDKLSEHTIGTDEDYCVIIIHMCLKRIGNTAVLAEQELVHSNPDWDQSTRLGLWICSWSSLFNSLNTSCPSDRKKTTKSKKKKKKDKKTTKRQRYTGQRLVHLALRIQLNSSTFILPELKDMEDKSSWTATFDD